MQYQNLSDALSDCRAEIREHMATRRYDGMKGNLIQISVLMGSVIELLDKPPTEEELELPPAKPKRQFNVNFLIGVCFALSASAYLITLLSVIGG